VPAASHDGGDSIYFTVPTNKSIPAILQATFEPNYQAFPHRLFVPAYLRNPFGVRLRTSKRKTHDAQCTVQNRNLRM